jgi:elongation factor P hydroxylase
MSADNLESGVGPSPNFARAVERERDRILARGLPDRAERFRAALAAQSSGRAIA